MSGNYKFLIFVFIFCISSCVSHKKGIYFQKTGGTGELLAINKRPYKIRSQDVLSVSISSLNPQTTNFFNVKSEEEGGFRGHIVSDSGYIFIPVLDSIKVKGLTIPESQQLIQRLIREHVTDATVLVQLTNSNFTILGEVNKPGLYPFQGTELTIIEALGMANDITQFGNKKNVLLIRKEGDIARFIFLDLTQRDLVASEYFYLQPSDALYVEPLKAKNSRLNISQASILIGFASLLLLVFNRLNL